MMHKLTEYQRNYAEENHNLIRDFLRHNRLDRADYYDVVALGYLEAVQAYDEDSKARKYEFQTIASRKMSDCLFKYWRYNSRLKRKAYLVSLDGACMRIPAARFQRPLKQKMQRVRIWFSRG